MLIGPRFDEAGDFSEGLALVKVLGTYGFIDKNGQYIVEPRFHVCESVFGRACRGV